MQQQRRRRHKNLAAGGTVVANVPDDCVLRLQMSSLEELGDDDTISFWPDSSGNGNDASQNNVSQQPTYQTVVFAGKTFPVARFDSDDDGMETPLFVDGAFSIFALWRLADAGVFSGALVSSASRDWSIGNLNGQMLCYFDGWSATAPVTGDAFYLVEARVVPGSSPVNIFLNGVQVGIAGGGSSAPDQVMLGASGSNGYPGNCDCAELIVFDRFLSDDEAGGVRAYFQQQYNYLQL